MALDKCKRVMSLKCFKFSHLENSQAAPLSSHCCDAIPELKVDFKAFNDMHVKYAACFSLTQVNGIVQATIPLAQNHSRFIVDIIFC